MTMTYDEIWHKIATVYDENEAKAIARYVLDVCFGSGKGKTAYTIYSIVGFVASAGQQFF